MGTSRLDALAATDGPLAVLAQAFSEAAPWLGEFDQPAADRAADWMVTAAGHVADTMRELNIALRLIHPLAH